MIQMRFHHAGLNAWQSRLSRIPRWGWIAIAIGVVLPLVALGAVLLGLMLLSAMIVFGCVLVAGGILALAHRLTHRKKLPAPDGRENVKIIVRSARIIDPDR